MRRSDGEPAAGTTPANRAVAAPPPPPAKPVPPSAVGEQAAEQELKLQLLEKIRRLRTDLSGR